MRRSAPFLFLGVGAFTGAVAAACGGATDTGLFDSPSGSDSIDAGLRADASVPHSSDAGGTVTTHDSGATTVPDSSTGTDAGHTPPPPPAATIDCAVSASVTTCDAATQVCCRTTNDNGFGGGQTTYACTPPSGCTAQGTLAIPCDDAADCTAEGFASGTVCCVTEDPSSGVAASVACTTQAACSAQTQTWLCDGTSDCPAGDTCSASTTTIPGYDICRK